MPLGQQESQLYDAAGNRRQTTDFNGQVTLYAYDDRDRLTSISYHDGTVETFGYDPHGNRSSANDRDSQTQSWAYDNRHRLIGVTDAAGNQIDYQYDLAGNKTRQSTTPLGGATIVTTYAYDVLNRLQGVTDASTQTTSYAYDNNGNRASVAYPNGQATTYGYDANNRLIAQTSTDSLGTVIADYQYTLDPSGHRLQITEPNRSTTYTYDNSYKLLTEAITDPANGDYSASYDYDKVGNRSYSTINGVQTQYSYDANDRLLQQGGEVFGYDNNGNTLTKTIDGYQSSYAYDAKNHLQGAQLNDTGVIASTSYRYDVDGIRIQKTEGTDSTDYLVDPNHAHAQVIRETTGGNHTDYLYGDDLIRQSQNAANERYYLYDGLGSTRKLSDNTGVITDSYDYEAFGSVLNRTGVSENSYQFTGEQYDSALDNYYLRARYYDQHVARFTQMDSWRGNNQDPVTLHKYLYGNSDPVNNIDPSGNFSLGSLSASRSIVGILATISTPLVVTSSTQSSINTGHAREFDETASNYHFYEMETTICIILNAACTVDKVFEVLRRFPAPGWDSSKLVNSGDRTTISIAGISGGGVVHTVNSPEVRNTTLPGHIFEEGYVDRIVSKQGSQIKIVTVGEGINRSFSRKFLNLISYGPAFSYLDRQIKGNVSAH